MVVSVYEERGIEKGIEQGRAQGIEEGIEQGVPLGKRSALLRLMERKFGTVEQAVRERLEAITEPEVLDRLLDHILTANSIEEMGL